MFLSVTYCFLVRDLQKYFEELIKTRQSCGLEVRTNGKHAKGVIFTIVYSFLCGFFFTIWRPHEKFVKFSGVYAKVDFKEGDLVLKDPVLFGIQHSSNKVQLSKE